MKDFYHDLNSAYKQLSIKHKINNLESVLRGDGSKDYWSRLAKGSYFEKLFTRYKYHFLYEIIGLQSQIHFGILNCLFYRDLISTERGRPNVWNHRFTFMIESTIHGIYSYWNRVALVLNTYLKKPKDLKRVYFATVVAQLVVDYPELAQDQHYQWLQNLKDAVKDLDRNEFAHNNSLIMQNFLPTDQNFSDFQGLMAMTDLLLQHNNFIVDEINHLVDLVEKLDKLI